MGSLASIFRKILNKFGKKFRIFEIDGKKL